MIKTQDEYCHQPGKDPFWNESFYCNFFDDSGQWGGVTRIGKSPNRQFADGLLCLYFPDGAVGLIRTYEDLSQHNDDVSCGALAHVRLAPPDRWQIHYDGPVYYFEDASVLNSLEKVSLVDLPRKQVDLQLDFEGWHSLHDFQEHLHKAPLGPGYMLRSLFSKKIMRTAASLPMRIRQGLKMSGAQHYEQAGTVTGSIKVDGQTVAFSGSGQRDHSWGVRDWKVPARWRWMVCQFGDQMAFNAMRVEMLGAVAWGGYCWRPQGIQPVRTWELDNTFDASGLGGQDLHITLHLANGEDVRIDGQVMVNIPMRLAENGHETVINEGRARYHWNGMVGYGVSEFLEQVEP